MRLTGRTSERADSCCDALVIGVIGYIAIRIDGAKRGKAAIGNEIDFAVQGGSIRAVQGGRRTTFVLVIVGNGREEQRKALRLSVVHTSCAVWCGHVVVRAACMLYNAGGAIVGLSVR